VRSTAAALVTALLVAVTALVAGAAPASAHATLIGTAPAADGVIDAPPEAVELRFDEQVEVVEDAVQVFGPDGDRVDRGQVEAIDGGATLRAPVDQGPQGTYTVAWRVTSEDGHTLSGSFVYHLGIETGAVAVDDGSDPTTAWVGGFGRWLGFAGTLAAVGAAVLTLAVRGPGAGGRPGARRPSPRDDAVGDDNPGVGGETPPAWRLSPRDDAVGDAGTLTAVRSAPPAEPAPATPTVAAPTAAATTGRWGTPAARLLVLAVAGGLAGALGTAVALVAMIAESAGRDLSGAVGLVPDLAPDTRTGQLALARIGLCLATAGVAALGGRWRRAPEAVVAVGLASLAAASLAGHAWTAPDRWLAVGADVAHLAGVAVWVGGLLALLVALGAATDQERLAARFSALAVAAVPVVVVSGAVSGWQQVRTLDGLTSTAYGRLLLAKVAGVAVMVALGWVNRSRLVPQMRRAVAPLTRSLRVETAVAALVLALTAALIHQAPARATADTGPFTTTVAVDGTEMAATVDPATTGLNDIHLYFTTAPDGGGPAEPLDVDAVRVTAGTTGVPPRRLPVTPISTDHVTVSGASLPSAGTWTIEVTAVRAGEPLVYSFEVPIS
jgi:copper transport protein